MLDERDPTDEEEAAEDREESPSDAVGEGEDHHEDADDPHDYEDHDDDRGLFGRFTRKLRDRRELTDDAWRALGAVLTTSDKAKSDLIRMAGREVRHYLDGLQLTDDLRDLVTNHSLEIKASLHLKPLPRSEDDTEPDE